ncbi:GIY-YIG catalytic domain-containing protein [Staphylococcus epidermidis]|uniref:GIY-YIG nuclease family protein n=4 Tax=Staphylococcus epidermidis TaxID=1282 RepID=UPI000F870F3B|nr:GIY-YIG nuclease family protein [Staphylococcus epidermidis]MBC2966359.1 GIY-YIG nuclease family protein [Staphylococcus epidermidis]MBC3110406.1 GIY-YIG nuclease family protein [Staphylococcus epidermidis]MCG1334892.1 GIY-YIG nuclease family protein [Staphylococcus epidermidis]MCG1527193.1 GIY-YIG nuclease family protein [Staphylococcus epidermidis]MCG1730605.1 GIY-YIG nuclease family protein [Staphylococcus epidermidis]
MIELNKFIKVPNLNKTKIKFNMNAGNVEIKAWDLLFKEDETEWEQINAWKTKHPNNNLNHADYLLAFAQYYPYGPEYFIFGGLYKIKKIGPEVYDEVGYELTLMEDYKEYRKRLIVKLKKPIGRDLYNRLYKNIQDTLEPEVYEIAPNTKLGHFPGYQNVTLSHPQMQQIILRNEPSWKQALMNVKGVYVITDLSNGKLYIGSASGNTDGIWQRWSDYANIENLTGGNKLLNEIKLDKGKDYIVNNFQYSILEIFDTKTKANTIINRENYWKNVFCTRKYGMNYN